MEAVRRTGGKGSDDLSFDGGYVTKSVVELKVVVVVVRLVVHQLLRQRGCEDHQFGNSIDLVKEDIIVGNDGSNEMHDGVQRRSDLLDAEIRTIGLGVGVDVHVDVLSDTPTQGLGRQCVDHELVDTLRIGHTTRHECDTVFGEVLTDEAPRRSDVAIFDGLGNGRKAVFPCGECVDRVRRHADVSHELEPREIGCKIWCEDRHSEVRGIRAGEERVVGRLRSSCCGDGT